MSKYSIPDDHEWGDEKEPGAGDDGHAVEVDTHSFHIHDERDSIERYNGLQWWFVVEDGQITAIDLSHYCPGPGHTDPMGFVGWSDVPRIVQLAAIRELNGRVSEDVVDVEATEGVAEVTPP